MVASNKLKTGFLMSSRVLITGGSGFIGTNLVEHFAATGNQVINLDVCRPRNPDHGKYWKCVDLLNKHEIRESIQSFQPHVVLHMGARTDLEGKSVADYSVNTTGVSNLIDAIDGVTSLQRVIFASSRLVCRIGYQPSNELDYCPSTPYGESKVIGEQIVRAASGRLSCSWLIVRPTSIWGPWFDVPYKTFFTTIAKGRYLHPGKEKIAKSFGFVGNTVFELQRLIEANSEVVSNKTYYLADYPPIDVLDMAINIQRAIGAAPIKSVNIGVLRVLAFSGDMLKWLGWPNPPLTSFRLDNLLTEMLLDTNPLEKVVGTLPYSMPEGVDITVHWLMQQREIE